MKFNPYRVRFEVEVYLRDRFDGLLTEEDERIEKKVIEVTVWAVDKNHAVEQFAEKLKIDLDMGDST